MSKTACLTTLRMLLLLCFVTPAGCAGRQNPYSDASIDFQYEMQGAPYTFSQLRGRPTLLVLVRISEVTNEMHLDQIQAIYAELRNRVNVVVLSIAPNEAPMLDMFVEFHDYPFYVGIADWRVAAGQSMLGRIPDIPTSYVMDENGKIQTLFIGATNGQKILETLRLLHIIP